MKRACLQKNNNNDEQSTCELHRVKMYNNEINYNRQLTNNF